MEKSCCVGNRDLVMRKDVRRCKGVRTDPSSENSDRSASNLAVEKENFKGRSNGSGVTACIFRAFER